MVEYEDRVLIDTNVIIYILSGNESLAEMIHSKIVYLSVISELELLSFPGLTRNEEFIINSFLDGMTILDINDAIKSETKRIGRTSKLKLPDAIVAATSSYLNCPLMTGDKSFQRLTDLDVRIISN